MYTSEEDDELAAGPNAKDMNGCLENEWKWEQQSTTFYHILPQSTAFYTSLILSHLWGGWELDTIKHNCWCFEKWTNVKTNVETTIGKRKHMQKRMEPVGIEPTRLASLSLKLSPLNHSGIVPSKKHGQKGIRTLEALRHTSLNRAD